MQPRPVSETSVLCQQRNLVALGAITWRQFAISMALIVAAIVAVARLATGIYRTATLRTGAQVRLRDLVPLPGVPLPGVPLPRLPRPSVSLPRESR